MIKAGGKHACDTCGKEYDPLAFQSALEHEIDRLKKENAKQQASFAESGRTKDLETDREYNELKERIKKLSHIIKQVRYISYCSEKCSDEAEAKAALKKEEEDAKASELAENRHNPLHAVKKDPFAFLLGILQWGVPMFLLWRGFLPLPVTVLAAVFISYISRWSSIYKLFNKFELAEPMSNFAWIFAFMYALGGAVEVLCVTFPGVPLAVLNAAVLLGRGSSYTLMALVALALTVSHSLLKKSALKNISHMVAWCLTPVAAFAIPIFSLFRLLSNWIYFPISAIIAVVGGVAFYKRFKHWGIAGTFFANLALSETLFA